MNIKGDKIIIQSKEDALELFKELTRAKSAVKQMEDALKEYVKENGEVADEEVDVRMQFASREPQWVFDDISNVYQMLFFDQLDPNKFFNITGTKAKQLAKIWSEEEMELAGGRLKERSDQFKITK